MGLLDRLFGVGDKGSVGLFKRANGQWQVLREALLRGDDATAQAALLEVVRLCQEAIALDPEREGDSYVLLTNALLRGGDVYAGADEAQLTRYAAACIDTWWSLHNKSWPVTRRHNYEIGVRLYHEVLQRLEQMRATDPAATMAQCSSDFGNVVTSPGGFEFVKAALASPRIAATEQADAEESIRSFEKQIQADPEDSIAWSLLGHHYHDAGRFKDSEQALKTSAQLARAKQPDVSTADWNAHLELGLLYFAALSNSVRGKGVPVWGHSPSRVTPELLGRTAEEVRVLAQQYLAKCDETAEAVGMWQVPMYLYQKVSIRRAIKAIAELSDDAFRDYDDLVDTM